jgi:GntR family transcriptional regulator, transcriptional repressor for pyruvate dehydrogenase complex
VSEPATTPRTSAAALPKASTALADELRERILRGDFVEDTPLPAERELGSQSGSSRATVREALRILEAQGLVRIKTGRSGGAYVQRLDHDAMVDTVSLLIRGRRIRMTTLLETREAVEPQCAGLAAKYRDDSDLRRLDAAVEATSVDDTLENFRRGNVEWHVAVAAATHNELLTGLMVALSQAIFVSTDNRFLDSDWLGQTVRAHRAVNRAIHDRDSVAATRRMGQHVHAYAEAVLETPEPTEFDLD